MLSRAAVKPLPVCLSCTTKRPLKNFSPTPPCILNCRCNAHLVSLILGTCMCSSCTFTDKWMAGGVPESQCIQSGFMATALVGVRAISSNKNSYLWAALSAVSVCRNGSSWTQGLTWMCHKENLHRCFIYQQKLGIGPRQLFLEDAKNEE